MAHPSKRALEYIQRVETMQWAELRALWLAIQVGELSEWEPGKALEHLVVRAFRLSGLEAEYPYDVPASGRIFEQIDGIAHWDNLAFLIECKDTRRVKTAVFAKIKGQLDRRPPTTFGMVFTTGTATTSALVSVALAIPVRTLIWEFGDIDAAIAAEDFRGILRHKYHKLCRYGLGYGSPIYGSLKAKEKSL